MKNLITKNLLKMAVAGINILMLSSCNGIFDEIYDQPKEIVPAKGQLVIDATSWADWYYVDLDKLHQLTINGDEEALLKAQTEFAAYPIPMEPTGDKVTTPVTDKKRDSTCTGLTYLERASRTARSRISLLLPPRPLPKAGHLPYIATTYAQTEEPCLRPPTPLWTNCLRRARPSTTCNSQRTNGPRTRFGTLKTRACLWAMFRRKVSR